MELDVNVIVKGGTMSQRIGFHVQIIVLKNSRNK